MGASKNVVVVILNFNRWRQTIDCVMSLQVCGYSTLELIIVDNCSSDGSEKVLREKFPALEIYQTGRNLGYTGGINYGIAEARKKNPHYILLLNEDTLVTPHFLDRLVEAMEANAGAAAACGTIYHHPDATTIWYAGGRMIPWRGLAVHDTHLDVSESGGSRAPRKVTFITGCMMLIRVSMLDRIGVKDERYFMHLEDIEHSARILRQGLELLYVPDSIIYHRIPVKYESALNLYYSVRNRMLLIETSFGNPYKFISKAYFLAVIVGKLAYWRFIKPSYYRAASTGLQDYFHRCFYEGRGVKEFFR